MKRRRLKSPIRYPGGKYYAVREIRKHFPPLEGKALLSPFFGGGNLELTLCQEGTRVVGGDIFEPLANFWAQALTDAERLADRAESFYPSSKEKFYALRKSYPTLSDPVERAATFFILNRWSFSGLTFAGGYSQHKSRPHRIQPAIDNLRRFRAPTLSFHHLDYMELMLHFMVSGANKKRSKEILIINA